MRTFLVLRHGKSSWPSGVEDHDRPLKGRGKRAARRIGQEIRERGLVPDLIVSSTAQRARSTAGRVAEAAGYDGGIVKSGDLYLSSVERQLATVAELAGDDHRRVMVVGHNPTSEELVEHLTGEKVRLTTANLACIDLDIESWHELGAAHGTLRFVLRPRELA